MNSRQPSVLLLEDSDIRYSPVNNHLIGIQISKILINRFLIFVKLWKRIFFATLAILTDLTFHALDLCYPCNSGSPFLKIR